MNCLPSATILMKSNKENPTMRKNRVPFFSKSYCREMLREFSTTGIVFASIEFVASMLSFFGITQNLLSMLLYGANVYIQSSAVSYVSLFCFVAGFVFVVKHLVRSAWDFRGSIPVANEPCSFRPSPQCLRGRAFAPPQTFSEHSSAALFQQFPTHPSLFRVSPWLRRRSVNPCFAD